MAWFKVDDNLTFHHKVVAAGNPAMGLWVRAGSWCALQLTDGVIPDHMLAALGTKGQAERLVSVGLWERVEGAYRFHAWSERQPSKADVEAERAAARLRMQKARAARKGVAPQVTDGGSSEVRPNLGGTSGEVTVTRPSPSPSPSPDPVPVPNGTEKSGRKRPAHPIPDDWQPTDSHKAYADEHGLDLNGEAFRFRNDSVANDRRYVVWNAAFAKWLSNSEKWGGGSKRSKPADDEPAYRRNNVTGMGRPR